MVTFDVGPSTSSGGVQALEVGHEACRRDSYYGINVAEPDSARQPKMGRVHERCLAVVPVLTGRLSDVSENPDTWRDRMPHAHGILAAVVADSHRSIDTFVTLFVIIYGVKRSA